VIPSHPPARDPAAVTTPSSADEVTQLRDRVTQLQSQLDDRARRRTRGRSLGLSLLLVLGCVLVALSLIALYVRAEVLNEDRYVDTMAPIAASPAVQQAVTDKLDAAIDDRVDFAALLREALPPRVDPLAPALADTLHQAVRTRLDAFVASDEFQRLWVDANRRAHARVVALLTTGESGRLLLEGDTVYLDLGPAIDRVRSGLEQRGLERLAGAIPSSVDGRVTLLQSDAFVEARNAVDTIETLAIVLPILALICLAAYVWLSRPRRRGFLRVGIGLVVTALLMLALIGIGRTLYLDAVPPDVLPRQAAADIFDALIALLRAGVRVVALAGIVVVLFALVLGHTDAIARQSRAVVRGLATDQRVAWVAEHRGALQIGAVVIGALVLLAWEPPTAAVVLIDAALVIAAVLVVAAIAGLNRDRAPAAAPSAAPTSSTPGQ
jgi:hypothetical protein